MPQPSPSQRRPPLWRRLLRTGLAIWSQHRDDGPRGLARAVVQHLRHGLQKHLGHSYRRWTTRYDTPGAADLQHMRRRATQAREPVTIALVVPVYEVQERWLRRALDSVLEQTWPHWQLCIADDASAAPHVRRVLEEYRARESRISVVFRERQGHISAASNSALELATAAFVGFLDHDDELPPTALQLVAEEIAAHPQVNLVYTDEDKIGTDGRRSYPHFKPAYSPELLLSYNYVTHLAVYRTSVVRGLGGLREGFEGSQDYDLVLRVIEQSRPEQVRRVPHVCYHWRSLPGSTSQGAEAKPYALEAGRRAITEHLSRTGTPGEVQMIGSRYRARFAVPSPAPKVSVIIPTRDAVELLRTAVEGVLERTDYPSIELIVVDNQSRDPATLAYLRELGEQPRARVVSYDQPFNYPLANAAGAAAATGEVLLLLNNDIEVLHDDWLTEMVSQLLRPGVGIVGARLLYADRSVQHGGVILGLGGVAGHAHLGLLTSQTGYMNRALVLQNLSAVTGACMAVRRAVYDEVGGLDPVFRVAYNDIDFCLRVRQCGHRIVYTPFAELVHHESVSRGRDDTAARRHEFAAEMRRMRQRWGALIDDDPYYSPNLRCEDGGFQPAFPPRVPRPWRRASS